MLAFEALALTPSSTKNIFKIVTVLVRKIFRSQRETGGQISVKSHLEYYSLTDMVKFLFLMFVLNKINKLEIGAWICDLEIKLVLKYK